MLKEIRVARTTVSDLRPVPSGSAKRVETEPADGFLGGTKLHTPYGHVDVADLKPGAQVETFDNGMKEVRKVVQQRVWSNRRTRSLEHWPFLIPQDVLGNTAPIRLLQHQVVLLECDLVEKGIGDPFMLVPLRALEGFQGISPVQPVEEQILYHLVFERPEMVAIAQGAYVLNDYAQSLEIAQGSRTRFGNCKAMSLDKTSRFLDFLEQGGCDHCEGVACGRHDCKSSQ